MNDGVTVIEISPQAGGFTPYATVSLHPRPGEAGATVRALLDGMPAGTDGGGVDPTALAHAADLVRAGAISVVLGRQSLAESGEAAVDAASALLARKPDTRFLPALRRANVNGALDMGLAPGVLPGRVTLDAGRQWFADRWTTVPAAAGLDARGILQAAADGRIDVLVLLGADPLADFPDHDLATRALAGARTVIALDQFANASVQQADIVLPAAGFAEVEGTATNIEGRVSRLDHKVTAPGTARPDWIIAAEIARRLGADLGVESVAALQAEIAANAPAYAGVTAALLESPAAADGLVVPLPRPAADPPPMAETQVTAVVGPPDLLAFEPTQATDLAPLDSYSLRLVATRKLYDRGTLVSHATSLAKLAPGTILRVNPYDFDRLGVAAGDRVRLRSSRATLTAEISVDAGVPRGAASVVFNQPGLHVAALIDAAERVTDVRVETGAV